MSSGVKALFLDRDGVINIDNGYVYKKEDFIFNDGIFELCITAQKNKFKIFIVTNQSGIGRGYYSDLDFLSLNTWMINVFKKKGVNIENVYYCPHLPTDNCNCRKPKTEMVDLATQQYNLDLSRSILIGDNKSDINLGILLDIGLIIGIGSNFDFALQNKNILFFDEIKNIELTIFKTFNFSLNYS